MCLRINPNSKFQKESPYLEDVNELIELAHQMGLIDAQIEKYVWFYMSLLINSICFDKLFAV